MLSDIRRMVRHILEASERCEIHLNSASIRNRNASKALSHCSATSQVKMEIARFRRNCRKLTLDFDWRRRV